MSKSIIFFKKKNTVISFFFLYLAKVKPTHDLFIIYSQGGKHSCKYEAVLILPDQLKALSALV